MSPTEKVMMFIDGSNIFWASKRRGHKINYIKLRDLLVGSNRRLVRAYYYCAIGVPPTKDQIRFHDKLKFSNLTVVTKPLKKRESKARLLAMYDKTTKQWNNMNNELIIAEKFEEKGVDVALVTDMISMGYKNAYDTAILVGGDEDFLSAINDIKMIPKRVEIAAYGDTDTQIPPRWISTISRKMIMTADYFYALEKLVNQIKM